MKINNIVINDHPYLAPLGQISKPPRKLFMVGSLPELRVPTVVIIGTRKPTPYGQEITHRFAYDLAKRGVVIVSGLALGVDGIAHRAALEAGGITIAFIATDIAHVSPRSHIELARKIVTNNGAIMSEIEHEGPVYKSSFLVRNRLVAGLADAVLVTEASARSGTLNTVSHALDQNKEVFVVPGNITSPQSAGCNSLLKQGAHPATCVEDILEIVAPILLDTKQSSLPLGGTPLEMSIITYLQNGIRDGDELQKLTNSSASDFSIALTMLEINGAIRPLGANQWTIK